MEEGNGTGGKVGRHDKVRAVFLDVREGCRGIVDRKE